MIFLGWSYHINSLFGDHCHAKTWNQCRWDAFCFCMVDKIWCYLSAFMIPSVLKRSPTPLAEIKPKTMAEPSLCFTDGCRLLYLSPDFQNVKIWIHHSIRPSHLFLVQHLYSWHTCLFSQFPSFKSGFFSHYSFEIISNDQLQDQMSISGPALGLCWIFLFSCLKNEWKSN